MTNVTFVGNSSVARHALGALSAPVNARIVSSRQVVRGMHLDAIAEAELVVFAHGSSVNGDLELARQSRLAVFESLKDQLRAATRLVLVSSCILPVYEERDLGHLGKHSLRIIDIQSEYERAFQELAGVRKATIVRLGTLYESFEDSITRVSRTFVVKKVRPKHGVFVKFADFEWVDRLVDIEPGVVDAANQGTDLSFLMKEHLGSTGWVNLNPRHYCKFLEFLGVRPVFLFFNE